MMNPMGSMPSVPGTGDDKEDRGLTRDEMQDEEREVVRQNLRDKYKIEKPVNEEEDEDDEEDDDSFGNTKKKEGDEDDDPLAQAQKLAEKQLTDAKAMAEEKCAIQ